jgi:hypothetical protein
MVTRAQLVQECKYNVVKSFEGNIVYDGKRFQS